MPLTSDYTSEYNWAAYKRAERGHNAGDHSICHPRRCNYAERLSVANEERLQAIALLAELEAQHMDAEICLGDDYARTVDLAAADVLPFPYLQADPDRVHQLQARFRVRRLDNGFPRYAARSER
jgi:hypothetical protein